MHNNIPLGKISINTNPVVIMRTYKIHSINFRDKQNGCSQYGMMIELQQK